MGTFQTIPKPSHQTSMSAICNSLQRNSKYIGNVITDEHLLTFSDRSQFLTQLSIFQKRLKMGKGQSGCIVSVLDVTPQGSQWYGGRSLCKSIREQCIEGGFMIKVKVEKVLWKVSELKREVKIDKYNNYDKKVAQKQQLSFLEALYLMNGGLHGFSQLKTNLGKEIKVCEDMVGIGKEGDVKVWINSDYLKNQTQGQQQQRSQKVLKNYHPLTNTSQIPDLVTSLFKVLQPYCKNLVFLRQKFEEDYQQFALTYKNMDVKDLQERRISFAKMFLQKWIGSNKNILQLFTTKKIGKKLIVRSQERGLGSEQKFGEYLETKGYKTGYSFSQSLVTEKYYKVPHPCPRNNQIIQEKCLGLRMRKEMKCEMIESHIFGRMKSTELKGKENKSNWRFDSMEKDRVLRVDNPNTKYYQRYNSNFLWKQKKYGGSSVPNRKLQDNIVFLEMRERSNWPKPKKIAISEKAIKTRVFKGRVVQPQTAINANYSQTPTFISQQRCNKQVFGQSKSIQLSKESYQKLVPISFGLKTLSVDTNSIDKNDNGLQNIVESNVNQQFTSQGFRKRQENIIVQEEKINTFNIQKSIQSRNGNEQEDQNSNTNNLKVKDSNNNSQQNSDYANVQCLIELKNILDSKNQFKQIRKHSSQCFLSSSGSQQKASKGSYRPWKKLNLKDSIKDQQIDSVNNENDGRFRFLGIRQIESSAEEEAKQLDSRNGTQEGNDETVELEMASKERTVNSGNELTSQNKSIQSNQITEININLKQKMHMGIKLQFVENCSDEDPLKSLKEDNLILEQAMTNRKVLKSYYDFGEEKEKDEDEIEDEDEGQEEEDMEKCYNSRSLSGDMSIYEDTMEKDRSNEDSHKETQLQDYQDYINLTKSKCIQIDQNAILKFKSVVSEGHRDQETQETSYAIFTQGQYVQRH